MYHIIFYYYRHLGCFQFALLLVNTAAIRIFVHILIHMHTHFCWIYAKFWTYLHIGLYISSFHRFFSESNAFADFLIGFFSFLIDIKKNIVDLRIVFVLFLKLIPHPHQWQKNERKFKYLVRTKDQVYRQAYTICVQTHPVQNLPTEPLV